MNKEKLINSYTSASTFPTKLLHTKVIKDGKIIPIHLQLSPTNVCNQNCSFCSCKDRDKKKELTFEQIMWVLDVCAERGGKTITITGGGEPLMHPYLNNIIKYAAKKRMKVGVVTNGILLDRLQQHTNLAWVRVSSSDDRLPSYDIIKVALKINPHSQWCFSHVVTKKPNYKIINDLINFANNNNFIYVRLVSDLCDLEHVPSMGEVKKNIKVNDDLVIYQGRKDSTKGTKDCYISLLKPVVAPEGIFPCCGAQYAIHGQPRDMIEKLRMGGDLKDLPEILDKQNHFDGRVCDVCYYSQYNDALLKLLNKPDGVDFV